MNRGIKRDHEMGICPLSNKEFIVPDNEDLLSWVNLTCSECCEQIGSYSCELRTNLPPNIDMKHKSGICPITNHQSRYPTNIVSKFICSECKKNHILKKL